MKSFGGRRGFEDFVRVSGFACSPEALVGACSCAPEGAEFVIGAKLRLAAQLSVCAAGGSL
ncbi:MAG: hypothetical protein LBO63_00960 [Oscillospiraceae bacterium]|nr:hypothetical protein [Oscillospiraceae bacterium]